MAEKKEVAVILTVDTGEAEKSMKNVEQALGGTSKSFKELSASFEDVYGEMKPLSGRMGEMEDRMYELALAGQQNTEEFKSLQTEVTKYKQVITQTDKEVDKLAEQGKLLGPALEIGTTVTAGYGALQGVMALAGQENEALMESLVKMQAAQSVLTGIEQLKMSLTKQSIIVTKLQAAQNWILTGSTTALTTATAASTVGMKLFRLALIATGIGAIVVALGLLITNFDKVSEAVIKGAKWVQGLAKEFREMGAGMQTLIGFLSFGLVPAISYAIEMFEKMGVVDTEETRKFKANIEEKIKGIAQQRDAHIKAKEDEIKASQDKFNEEDAALNHQMALMQANGEDTIKIQGEILENKRQSTAEQIALTEELLRTELKANLEILKLRAQTNDLFSSVLKIQQDAIAQAGGEDAYINSLIGTDEDLNKLKTTLKDTQNEIEIFEVEVSKIRSDAAEKNRDWREGINEEIIQGERRKVDAIKGMTSELAAFNLEEWQKEQDAKDAANQKELQDKSDLEQAKLGLASEGLSAAGNLVSLFGKKNEQAAKRSFQIQKGLSIAQATIDTYKGATAIFASAAANPASILFPAQPFIAAGLAVSAGIANVAKISQQQFQGGGAASGGGGSVSIPRIGSGGANGGSSGQAQQNDNLTNIADLLNNNNTPSPVLVVDSFNKVEEASNKVKVLSSI